MGIPSRSSSIAALACFLAACGAREPLAPTSDAGSWLDACQEVREAPDVTAFHCGDLTAVEAVVLSTTDREIAFAFDEFEANFGGSGVRRVDSEYAKGDARHRIMRLEGKGPRGEVIDAQMAAISVGHGARLVTCSDRRPVARDPQLPSGPSCQEIVAFLVHDRGALVSTSRGFTH